MCDGRDLSIRVADRFAQGTPARCDYGKSPRRITVKGKDAAGKDVTVESVYDKQ